MLARFARETEFRGARSQTEFGNEKSGHGKNGTDQGLRSHFRNILYNSDPIFMM